MSVFSRSVIVWLVQYLTVLLLVIVPGFIAVSNLRRARSLDFLTVILAGFPVSLVIDAVFL